ncbi:MAG: hypothetical protein WCL50_18460 [Spirochaetota bacterium]
MKKSVTALISVFAVMTMSFAQESPQPARFSMWNRGVFNLYQDNGTTSIGPNWMGYAVPQGAYNGLTMDWSAKDVGWTMTAEWEGDWAFSSVTTLSEFAGRYSMFDGLVRMTMGKVRSDGGFRFANFDTAGFSTRIADGETGVLMTIHPTKGLSIGTFLPVQVAERAVASTYSEMNFGAAWQVADIVIIKASVRLEPFSLWGARKGREFAASAQLTAVPALVATAGYRTYPDVGEHDLMLDASYRILERTSLHGFTYLSLHDGLSEPGGKLNVEHAFKGSPYVAGASLSYGRSGGYPAWWLDGWEANPYIRYEFPGSSVQAGAVARYRNPSDPGTFSYALQLAYTIGF